MQKKIYNNSNIIYYAVHFRMIIFSRPSPTHLLARPSPAPLLAITAFKEFLNAKPNDHVSSLVQKHNEIFSFLNDEYFKDVQNLTLWQLRNVCDTTQSVWYHNLETPIGVQMH